MALDRHGIAGSNIDAQRGKVARQARERRGLARMTENHARAGGACHRGILAQRRVRRQADPRRDAGVDHALPDCPSADGP